MSDEGLTPSQLMLQDAGTQEPVPAMSDPQFGGGMRQVRANPDPPLGMGLPAGYWLEVSVAVAPTSLQPVWWVDYAIWDSHVTRKKQNIGLSTTSPTWALVMPAAVSPDQHILQFFNLDNQDISAVSVTLRANNGTTTFRVRFATLQPGESLYFSSSAGWQVLFDPDDYLYTPGRPGGQFAYGGSSTGNKLTLRGNTVDSNGGLVNFLRTQYDDIGANPSISGEVCRNGSFLRFYDGTAVRDLNRPSLWSKISPSIGADQNDWAPTGHANASTIRVTATGAGRLITGLTAGADGDVKVIENIGALFITLKNESASSSAANRFILGGLGTVTNPDLSLWTGDSVTLEYDGSSSRWRVVARNISEPGCSVHRNAVDVSIPTGTQEIIVWTTEDWDAHGWHDTSNGRYTPLLPGKYLVQVRAHIISNDDTCFVQGSVYLNTTQYKTGSRVPQEGAGDAGSVVSCIVPCNGSTDYIQARVFHNSAAARNLEGDSQQSYMQIQRIGD